MTPYYTDGLITIYHGDCADTLPILETQFDAVVTDPPYGLRFMLRKWDYNIPTIETWQAILNSMKPGAHLLAFAGTRTQHRMAVNIEGAGFEIRDMICELYSTSDAAKMFVDSLDPEQLKMFMAAFNNESIGGWCFG